MSETLMQAALCYAASGMHVFPIYEIRPDGTCACDGRTKRCAPGKHPRTEHGLKDATTDETTIRAWWIRWPGANVGIRTGPESMLAVLDVDPKSGGNTSIEAISKRLGGIPPTRRVHTGGGGMHFYFRYPPERLANSEGKLAPGIDIRGDGGYVVAPPSNHESGNPYWEDPDIETLSEFPPDLLTMIADSEHVSAPEALNGRAPSPHRHGETSSYGRAALDGEAQTVASSPEGTRNGRLNKSAFRIGGLVAGGEISAQDAEVFIVAAARAAGLPDAEARDVFARGLEAGMQRPRTAPQMPDAWPPPDEPELPSKPCSWDLVDLLAEPDDPPPDEFVSRLFVRPSFNIVFGPPQAGKSWAVMALCLDAVMGGGNFLGCEDLWIKPLRDIRDGRPERCLWVFGSEDTRARVKRRLKTLLESGPHAGNDVPRGAFTIAHPPGGASIHMRQGWDWLVAKIKETGATLVVLDTIGSLTGSSLDANKAEQVLPFLARVNELRAELGIIIFAMHHTRKGSSDPKKSSADKADAMLGASAWRAQSEGVLSLDAPDGDTSKVSVVSVKAKDIDKPIPRMFVTLETPGGRFRQLDDDETPPEREPTRKGRPLAVTVEMVLALRAKYPEGVVWRDIPSLIDVTQGTWKNHSVRLQGELLKLDHVKMGELLKWGRA